MITLDRRGTGRVRVLLPDGSVGWIGARVMDENTVRLFLDFPLTVKIDREERIKKGQVR